MRILGVLLSALLCFFSLAQAEQEKLVSKPEVTPKIFQVSPADTTATLEASRWMQFSDCKGEQACCDILIGTPTKSGASLTYKKTPPPDFTYLDGMELEVPTENAASILITWTVRVEGETGAAVNPWRKLCSAWHGSITETYKGGQVETRAYVDYGSGFKKEGQIASMTIPDGGVVKGNFPHDPTHSGSCLLKASAEKKFPATIKVRIYWRNDTSMKVFSRPNYRSLIVTVLPAGNND